MRTGALADPAPAALRAETALRHQMLATSYCAIEHTGGSSIAIEPQQGEYGACAAAHNVQLLVCGNKIRGEQFRRHLRFREQVRLTEALRHRRQSIGDR